MISALIPKVGTRYRYQADMNVERAWNAANTTDRNLLYHQHEIGLSGTVQVLSSAPKSS
jgi:hypothetical protein